VVAGALPPPLHGMAGKIVTDVTPGPEQPAVPEPARPASSTRRGRCMTPWVKLRLPSRIWDHYRKDLIRKQEQT